jgi:hypothetical protein
MSCQFSYGQSIGKKGSSPLNRKRLTQKLKLDSFQIALSADFINLNESSHTILLDKISDDMEEMIERRRTPQVCVDDALKIWPVEQLGRECPQ